MPNKTANRLQSLRDKELSQELSATEHDEFVSLTRQADALEQQQLHGGTQRLQTERKNIEAQNQVLQHLVSRKERLAARLQTTLAEAQAERRAIDSEMTRVLSDSVAAS